MAVVNRKYYKACPYKQTLSPSGGLSGCQFMCQCGATDCYYFYIYVQDSQPAAQAASNLLSVCDVKVTHDYKTM